MPPRRVKGSVGTHLHGVLADPLNRSLAASISDLRGRHRGAALMKMAPGPTNSGRAPHPCCSPEDMVMDRFDFSPLFRSTIGFDRLARLVDTATRVDSAASSYPPYNIEKTGEDAYRLTMAVAGFSRDELDITVHENTLIVTGKSQNQDEDGENPAT